MNWPAGKENCSQASNIMNQGECEEMADGHDKSTLSTDPRIKSAV